MADDKKEDPRIAQARLRAQALTKSGPGRDPQQMSQFFKETWSELKKTTWPDKPTLTKSTMVVLAFIAATAIWVGLIDYVLTRAGYYIF